MTLDDNFTQRAHDFRMKAANAKQRLLDALDNPSDAQKAVLQDLNEWVASASWWQENCADLATLDTLRNTVSIRDYEGFRRALEREVVTKGGVLSSSVVARWLKTSGTTGNPKLIPYTQHWMRKYRTPGQYVMWDTYLSVCPQLLLHEHATLDTQSIREDAAPTIQGLPHQAISNRHPRIDSEDWNPPWYDQKWYGPDVPGTHEGRMYIRIRNFLGRDLRAITAINPSMIMSLYDELRMRKDELLDDLTNGTLFGEPTDGEYRPNASEGRRLREVLQNPNFTLTDVWPRLAFFSCWNSSSAAQFLPHVRQVMPDVAYVPFMACGTEGVVAIPISPERHAAPLAMNQAVYEFVPASEDPQEWVGAHRSDTLLPHEVTPGQRYHLIMSQGNGLLRLWTGDSYEITEIRNGVPWVNFVGRDGIFHSFTGEKLTHTDIEEAFKRVSYHLERKRLPYLIGPTWNGNPHYYVAVVESDADIDGCEYATLLDEELMKVNIEYASKRRSGRLGNLEVGIVPPDTLRRHAESERASTNQNQHKFQAHRKNDEFFQELREAML